MNQWPHFGEGLTGICVCEKEREVVRQRQVFGVGEGAPVLGSDILGVQPPLGHTVAVSLVSFGASIPFLPRGANNTQNILEQTVPCLASSH